MNSEQLVPVPGEKTGNGENSQPTIARQLLWVWAVCGLLLFSSLELQPPIAAKYWLLLLVIGVSTSICLVAIWLRSADETAQAAAKPWVLHYSALLVVGALAVLNLQHTGAQAEAAAYSLLLTCSLGFMTAGIYLQKRFLAFGLALAFCYLYWMLQGAAPGLVTGLVFAGGLLSISRA